MSPRYLINKPLRWTKYREGIFTFFEFSYLGRKIVGGQLLLSINRSTTYIEYTSTNIPYTMEINLKTSICFKQALKWFSEVVENLGINQ